MRAPTENAAAPYVGATKVSLCKAAYGVVTHPPLPYAGHGENDHPTRAEHAGIPPKEGNCLRPCPYVPRKNRKKTCFSMRNMI